MQDIGTENYFGNRAESNIQLQQIRIISETCPKPGGHENQDAFFQTQKALGVFDGVGSAENSQLASKYAASSFELFFKNYHEQNPTKALEDIKNKLIEINQEINSNFKDKIPTTTASVVYICGNKAIIGNVGDSRVYLLRNGNLTQITTDDNNIPNELQLKFNNTTTLEKLNNDEIKLFKSRNIINQALGAKRDIQPRMITINLKEGDRILVCSDGISDNLTNSQMQTILNENRNSYQAVYQLIQGAIGISSQGKEKNIRAKKDDMTAGIIEIGSQANSDELQLRIGQQVAIKNNDGKVENILAGWRIEQIDNTSGKITVTRTFNDKTFRIETNAEELKKLNRPTTLEDIKENADLKDLINIILRLRDYGIQGSEKFYTIPELIRLILAVTKDKEK